MTESTDKSTSGTGKKILLTETEFLLTEALPAGNKAVPTRFWRDCAASKRHRTE